MDALSEANGTFALTLLKKLGEDNSKNVLIAPLSISSALAMVLVGARGNTADQMCQSFKDACRIFYQAEMEELDFVSATEESRKHINTWVAEKTEGKIRDLLAANSVDPMTRLVLMNAIYFKGDWAKQFNKQHTMERPFYVSKNMQITVPMMYNMSIFKTTYIAEICSQILVLPYVGQEMNMVILLPSESANLNTVEKALTYEKFVTC